MRDERCARKSGNQCLDDFVWNPRTSAKHLLSKGSLTEVMASSYVFFIFWSAQVFYLLSTQGTAVEELKRVQVYNETDEATLKMTFKKYVQTHNRTYVNDPEEYNRRLSVFKVVKIASHMVCLSARNWVENIVSTGDMHDRFK